MERMERVNSSFDLDYDYYRKNLPAIDDSEEKDESAYEKIFESRKTFSILGLDSYIIISKRSLNKIADMINCYPQEYILFTNHKVIDEENFDKLIENEKEQINPIYIPEQNENDNDDGFKKVENIEKKINEFFFTRCIWLYLALTICSFWNFLFFMYILARTDYGFILYSFYILYLIGFLLFTGIFGFLKCRWRDFSGYTLKIFTCLIPISMIIDVIIYYISSIQLKILIKLIIDFITFILGVILILFIFNIIKTKNIDNLDEIKQGLLNDEKEDSPVYKF
jgi:hypothetical protein